MKDGIVRNTENVKGARNMRRLVLTLSRHREEFVGSCGRQDDGLCGKFRGRRVGS